MMLSIQNGFDSLTIDDIEDNEVYISLNSDTSEGATIYINHQDAIEIIKHLKQQFQL